MNLSVGEKQKLLENDDLKSRALATLKYMNVEFQKLELKNDIQSKVQMDMSQQQREYFLHQQIKTIQEELGGVSHDEEIEDMKTRALDKKWDEKVAKHFNKEIAKMQRMNPQVAEYSIQRNYLDLFLDLPWNAFSKDKFDLKRAMKILDRDHFGLEDVKKRIIEYLAVLKLRNDMKSPILCLYGPPGVGKTSLGKSIAEALGREYVRISLGGLRDEAEIRGHRKTYIGAMPGRIIQSLKKAGTSNPVFVLDEIDKLSNSNQGDPSSAMLEVLDPEQNNEFYDNFLEMGYDLSKVMFIATSNSLNTIQPALLDRMEIINVTGYTIEEKVEIGKRHLLPKQVKEHGLTDKHIKIAKPQLEKIVEGYTRESGVRGLEKQIAKMVRYAAKNIAMEEDYNVKISNEDKGATPKDGPSAGVTMLTSLVSLYTQKKVKKSLAMTGEITLRGKVLPVGGIKEKILAAKRARIKEILLCEDNRRDIEEIKPDYLKGLTFHYVSDMSDVIKLALTNQKVSGAKKL
ncbi:UNVERIFIED_CONTAM: hypothetical protein GTU68_013376 [Idotea baltica]|nr:hypothetical protein [Idotea baltica]